MGANMGDCVDPRIKAILAKAVFRPTTGIILLNIDQSYFDKFAFNGNGLYTLIGLNKHSYDEDDNGRFKRTGFFHSRVGVGNPFEDKHHMGCRTHIALREYIQHEKGNGNVCLEDVSRGEILNWIGMEEKGMELFSEKLEPFSESFLMYLVQKGLSVSLDNPFKVK